LLLSRICEYLYSNSTFKTCVDKCGYPTNLMLIGSTRISILPSKSFAYPKMVCAKQRYVFPVSQPRLVRFIFRSSVTTNWALASVRDIIIPIGGTRPPEPDNQCSVCKRTVPPPQLTRCPRCKQLFCRSCITEDLREGEYLICLNCARRIVSPKPSAFTGKYTPLTFYLSRKAQWKRWIKLQFSEI